MGQPEIAERDQQPRGAGTPFALHIDEGDTHGLTLNFPDMMARTIAFFEQYRTGK